MKWRVLRIFIWIVVWVLPCCALHWGSIRSRSIFEGCYFCLPGGEVQAAVSHDNSVVFLASNISLGAEESGLTAGRLRKGDFDWRYVKELFAQGPPPEPWGPISTGYSARHVLGISRAKIWYAIVPYWCLIAAWAALGVIRGGWLAISGWRAKRNHTLLSNRDPFRPASVA